MCVDVEDLEVVFGVALVELLTGLLADLRVTGDEDARSGADRPALNEPARLVT